MTCPHIRIHADGDEPIDETTSEAAAMLLRVEETAEKLFLAWVTRIEDENADDMTPRTELTREAFSASMAFWSEAIHEREWAMDACIDAVLDRDDKREAREKLVHKGVPQ
jgi:hypothetical protein